jgi:uncharacterized protein (DUF1697 family)
MNSYVALLRGINVGGKNVIHMDDLKKLFQSFKFNGVKTYIQTGNVVFKSPKKDQAELALGIEAGVKKKFGYEVTVIVRSILDLAKIIETNPFHRRKLYDGQRVYITYLASAPSLEAIKTLSQHVSENDECYPLNSEVYLLSKGGYATTLFSNAFIEKELGVIATTRNLETTKKLYEIGMEGL